MPDACPEFARLLPRLAAAYDRSLLVPFLGAGMSIDRHPSWAQLVATLESAVREDDTAGDQRTTARATGATSGAAGDEKVDPAMLIRRANAAVRALVLRRPDDLADTLRRALYDHRGQHGATAALADAPTDQTAALAAIWWPLVMTSNYDDLFATTYAERLQREIREQVRRGGGVDRERGDVDALPYQGHVRVLGRSRADCARVLASLTVTTSTVLWAVHGFLPRAGSAASRDHAALAREVVVGHDEYRRVAHAETYYRRAFAEVWRRRSLLFVGSGLADPYLLDLFSEVQELHGTNPQPHFALVAAKDNVDVEFLRTRFNIIVHEYSAYGELPNRLTELAEYLQKARPRQTHWAWHCDAPADRTSLDALRTADLTVEHAGLPTHLAPGEGMVVSAGFDDARSAGLYLSPAIEAVVERLERGGRWVPLDTSGSGAEPARVYERHPAGTRTDSATAPQARVLAVIPWHDRDHRDLALIPALLRRALAWAAARRIGHLRVQLLGVGASRHVPAAVSLTAILRTYARWRVEQRASRDDASDPAVDLPRLTVHVVDEAAIRELTSGRLDVGALLAAQDLQFWIETSPRDDDPRYAERLLREPALYPEHTTLRTLTAALGLPGGLAAWEFLLEPSPLADGAWRRVAGCAERPLDALGVLPGATLRLRPRLVDREPRDRDADAAVCMPNAVPIASGDAPRPVSAPSVA